MVTVETKRLRREFSGRNKNASVALEGVDLEVDEGEIFGLLGPNGAGKTTLIRILTTLLLPTSGGAIVCGHDVVREPHKVRPLIGVASGSERPGYDFITARGNLWFFSQLYGTSTREAKSRIDELSGTLGLDGYLDKKLYMLSTGYRQRTTIARGFINDPRVVFMDEPTTGLDVITAKKIREFLSEQARVNGRTIFLATHNMVEGDTICNRVAIIDRGRILACDTPASLKRQVGAPALLIESAPPQSTRFLSQLRGVKGVTATVDEDRQVVRIRLVVDDESAEALVTDELEKRGMKVYGTWRQEPTLEEVFVKFVGEGFSEREGLDNNLA